MNTYMQNLPDRKPHLGLRVMENMGFLRCVRDLDTRVFHAGDVAIEVIHLCGIRSI